MKNLRRVSGEYEPPHAVISRSTKSLLLIGRNRFHCVCGFSGAIITRYANRIYDSPWRSFSSAEVRRSGSFRKSAASFP